MTIEDEIVRQVLKLGLDDWIDLGWVEKIVKEHRPGLDSEQTLKSCLEIVKTMLSNGLVEVGDLTGEGGRFRRWEIDDQAALNEIERRWRQYGGVVSDAGGDFVCWLSNTEKGDRVAQQGA